MESLQEPEAGRYPESMNSLSLPVNPVQWTGLITSGVDKLTFAKVLHA